MDCTALIIFGITSNLAQIKLIPALYDMEEKGLLPSNLKIIGSARGEKSKEEFTAYLHSVLISENVHHKHPIVKSVFKKLSKKISYVPGQLDDPNFYKKLAEIRCKRQIYYLATYPDLYEVIFKNLKKFKLAKQNSALTNQKSSWVRLMIEKPIGSDLKSARSLNKLLRKYFSENQIYRLDHYLGKETIQNILIFRFANPIFESIMNNKFIDHIQITALEDFGIGQRGGYFDSVGMLKDVGQNHELQMLTFITMDEPKELSNIEIKKQREKLLKQLLPKPHKLVLGQYEGYLQEEKVKPKSIIDTFYALKTEINNERFKGVPIYIRAGKKMKKTVTEISIVFKKSKNKLFKDLDFGELPGILTFRIQPNEGVTLKFLTKKIGHSLDLSSSSLQFGYPTHPTKHTLTDPYERLISDVIKGDQTFFNNASEVELQWKFIDAVFPKKPQPILYEPNSFGPRESFELIEEDGREWIE